MTNGIIINPKKLCTGTKNYNCNPSTCIYAYDKLLKSISDTLIRVCDEIINATDSVSTNVTNTISTNMTNTIINKCSTKNYFNKNQNHYRNNIFLEKYSYQLAKK